MTYRSTHITCKSYSDHDYICPVGRDIEECKREVDLSIQRLFYWGAYADKYGGQLQVRSCDDLVNLLIEFSYEYQQCPGPSPHTPSPPPPTASPPPPTASNLMSYLQLDFAATFSCHHIPGSRSLD